MQLFKNKPDVIDTIIWGFPIANVLTGFVAGILLELILDPIAESDFRDMMTVSDNDPIGYILGRPISIVIVALILFALYVAL